METYLILGGAGFIGSHFCDYIIDLGQKVVCFDDLSLGKIENIQHLIGNPSFNFIKSDVNDINDEDKLKGYEINTVVHLAANSDIAKSHSNPDIDIKNTLNSTLSILKFMRNNGIKKIIFASSSAIYGEHFSKIHEDIGPLFPHSHYGAAKLASEAFISSFCENYQITSWIIRFPNVIGDRTTHGVIFDFVNKIKNDPTKLDVLGDGQQDKPYIHVLELVDGIMYFYNNYKHHKVNYVNIGVDTSTTVNRIIEILKEVFEINPKINFSGGSKGWIGDIPKFHYDLSKIHDLGWRASLTSDEAVYKTLKSLK